MAKKPNDKPKKTTKPVSQKQPFKSSTARTLATMMAEYAIAFEEIANGIDEFPDKEILVRGGAGTESYIARVSGLAGNCCRELGYVNYEAFRAAMTRRSQALRKPEDLS